MCLCGLNGLSTKVCSACRPKNNFTDAEQLTLRNVRDIIRQRIDYYNGIMNGNPSNPHYSTIQELNYIHSKINSYIKQ